ncbi:LptF/LptG family permease [Candidatus Neomarinimicrobiota bacterium]
MKVFHRYILKEHFGPFSFALIVLLFVLLTNFMLRAIDRFLGKGISILVLMEYVALNLAWIAALAVPMAVLVATLMAFGRMSSDNEITALRTAGVSYTGLMLPALLFGSIICLGLIAFNNKVLPEANHKARLLSSDISRKRPDLGIEVGYFIDDLPDYSMLVRGQTGDIFTDLTIYSKNNRNSQVTIFAQQGTMQTINDAIVLNLENGEIHELDIPEYAEYRRLKFEQHRILIPVDNLFLERRESEQRGDREMDVPMMNNKIADYQAKIQGVKGRVAKRLESQTNLALSTDTTRVSALDLIANWRQVIVDSTSLTPADSTRLVRRAGSLSRGINGDFNLIESYIKAVGRYQVEVYKKFAIPFACVVFILIGAPIGIMARRGGFVVATSLSMGFFVIYWILLIAGEELADRGIIPPLLAMWGGNLLLAPIGIFLIMRLQHEQHIWKMDILDIFRRKNNGPTDDTAVQG